MKSTLYLAWRYVAYHRWRSSVLAVGVALTLFLPIAVELLVNRYGASLVARAEATPLVVGAPQSRYDLVLEGLYFQGRIHRPVSMAEVDEIHGHGLTTPIPIYSGVEAGDHPVVGTVPEYFDFRGLTPASGSLPVLLGECALGADVARREGKGVGDTVITTGAGVYDLAGAYPLEMQVTGVLHETGTADDGAIFCGLETSWVAAGLGHGHDPADELDPNQVIGTGEDGEIVVNAAAVEFTRITEENRGSFHFHGDASDRPVTAILIDAPGRKELTLQRSRFLVRDDVQALVPIVVMEELLGVVFQAKRFFDANTLLVGVATSLLLGVIVTLLFTVRRGERLTLYKLGSSRGMVLRLMGTELLIVVGAGAALAMGAAALLAANL